MKFTPNHLLSTKDVSKKDLFNLFKQALKCERIVKKGKSDLLKGKILSTLFFEPSTRTRMSFEAAMLRLGGSVISNADMKTTSSLRKMESLKDTGKVISTMVDIMAVRHNEPGAVKEISEKSAVPVINAGDGSGEHPTQALLDIYTIWKEKRNLNGLTIGIIGDLKNGRVPHSQCFLLKHFKVNLVFVSPKSLKMPKEITAELKKNGLKIRETENLKKTISEMDIALFTRIQKERFSSLKEYNKCKAFYVLDKKLLKEMKKDALILHPLPRVDEVAPEVDDDSRARYFDQVKNGVVIRMALMLNMLGKKA